MDDLFREYQEAGMTGKTRTDAEKPRSRSSSPE
jgi:hypothetical protein